MASFAFDRILLQRNFIQDSHLMRRPRRPLLALVESRCQPFIKERFQPEGLWWREYILACHPVIIVQRPITVLWLVLEQLEMACIFWAQVSFIWVFLHHVELCYQVRWCAIILNMKVTELSPTYKVFMTISLYIDYNALHLKVRVANMRAYTRR